MFGSDLLAGDRNLVLRSVGELKFVLWKSCWSEELIQRSCKVHRALACATPQARPPQRWTLARGTTSSVHQGIGSVAKHWALRLDPPVWRPAQTLRVPDVSLPAQH